MTIGLGQQLDILWFEVLVYTGSDPTTIAAVDSFNAYFSLTFMFGILAFICTMIFTLLARS